MSHDGPIIWWTTAQSPRKTTPKATGWMYKAKEMTNIHKKFLKVYCLVAWNILKNKYIDIEISDAQTLSAGFLQLITLQFMDLN